MKRIIKQLVKESGIYSLQPIFEKMVGFMLIPIYTAYLAPADYGILQYIMTLGLFLFPIMNGGLETSFWKFRTEKSGYSNGQVMVNVFVTQLVLAVSVVLIVYLVYKSNAFDRTIGALIIVYIIAVATSIVYKNVLLLLRAQHRTVFYVVVSIIYSICLALSNIYFIAYLHMNFKGIIYSNLLINIIFSLCLFYVLYKEFEGSPQLHLSRKMLKYSGPIALGNIASIVISLSDRFFLKAYSTDFELGLYSFGCQFGNLVLIFLITPFILGWNPIRWEVYEMDNAKEIFGKIYELLLIALPVGALIMASIGIALGSFMANNAEYLSGFSIVTIIAFSHLFYGLYYFNVMGMLFMNKTKLISLTIIIPAVINLILNYILIPNYGMEGAGIATLFSYFIMFIMARFYCQKYYYVSRNNILEVLQIFLISLISIISLVVFNYQLLSLFKFTFLLFCLAVLVFIINVQFTSVRVRGVIALFSRN
jgi:O-antigen/teichoic acid export membrane protein